jgi:mono/diheme cytochrome c family protein
MHAGTGLLWASGAVLVIMTAGRSAAPAEAAEPTAAVAATASAPSMHDGEGDRINGRKVFLRENCYICHGGRAGGGMCPNLRDDPPDKSDIEHVIEDGTSTGMPSFRGRVSKREVEDLAAYFASLRSVREPTFTHWWESVPTR